MRGKFSEQRSWVEPLTKRIVRQAAHIHDTAYSRLERLKHDAHRFCNQWRHVVYLWRDSSDLAIQFAHLVVGEVFWPTNFNSAVFQFRIRQCRDSELGDISYRHKVAGFCALTQQACFAAFQNGFAIEDMRV